MTSNCDIWNPTITLSRQSDGWIPNITIGGHNGEEDYQAYGVTLLFTPNDRFEALLTLETMHDKSALKAYNQNFNVAPEQH